MGAQERQNIVCGGESAEVAFVGHQDQLDIGQVADGLLGVVKRDDRVGVAGATSARAGDVGEAEAPVAAEESAVIDRFAACPPATVSVRC